MRWPRFPRDRIGEFSKSCFPCVHRNGGSVFKNLNLSSCFQKVAFLLAHCCRENENLQHYQTFAFPWKDVGVNEAFTPSLFALTMSPNEWTVVWTESMDLLFSLHIFFNKSIRFLVFLDIYWLYSTFSTLLFFFPRKVGYLIR